MPSEEIVLSDSDPQGRLDAFLSQRFPEISRSQWQRLIKAGEVKLNGKTSKGRVVVKAGDQLQFSRPTASVEAPTPQPEAIDLEILFEDEWLLIVNKPEGLVVHPGAGCPSGTLVNGLLHLCDTLSDGSEPERPGIVHRLDKETSGCLAVAKTNEAHQALSDQFHDRTTEKIYLAIVRGVPDRKIWTVENHLGRNPGNRQKRAVVKEGQGKWSRSEFHLIDSRRDRSLLHCHLHTGRTHQLRVHLKHSGHPILGDPVYGKGTFKTHPVSRLLLHAWKLGIDHPKTGERLNFEAPAPSEFEIERDLPKKKLKR